MSATASRGAASSDCPGGEVAADPSSTRDARRRVIITIDGPAGTGKSSVAGKLAARLGLEFLDTGAMYRAASLLAIERGLRPDDGPAIAAAVGREGVRFLWGTRRPAVLLGGRDVSDRIRELDVSAIVSIVAGCTEVRQVMVGEQRRIAEEHPRLVTEGRDQGSVVFPDAPIRFFLDADPEVRAARRTRQLEEQGKRVAAEAIRADIATRDRLDASRAEGPLVRPVGAIELDTTDLSLDAVVDALEAIVRDRLPDAGLRQDPKVGQRPLAEAQSRSTRAGASSAPVASLGG
ncbi:MAG TPA: (d)CMP kinase [Phycisphaerales bacterium]|nr:(d)CMP kinase [Phycisphaerales bacterium]HMP38226.1 (d)CMP kinase [Phycisphaerales bacterium]